MTAEPTMPEIMARMGRLTAYAVFMRPTEKYNTESDDGRELMRRHLLFQLDMQDRGVLLAAGPIDGGGSASTLEEYKANAPMTPEIRAPTTTSALNSAWCRCSAASRSRPAFSRSPDCRDGLRA